VNVGGLGQQCAVCQRVVGDHTLREWFACMGTVTTDLPYEGLPADLAEAAAASLRERFRLDDDMLVADHVNLTAFTLRDDGPLQIMLPAVLHEFQIGSPDSPPHTVAKVAFIGDVRSVRGYGRLVRDTSNGAANAVEPRRG
jgi:hypothetical protein